ncbi:unnamed protein product, partial [Heterotrigona itama]
DLSIISPPSTISPTNTFAIPDIAMTTFCDTEQPVIAGDPLVIEVEKEIRRWPPEFDGETELRGEECSTRKRDIENWPGLGTISWCEEATEVETHHQQTAATTMGVAEDETPSSLTSHPNPNVNNSNQE